MSEEKYIFKISEEAIRLSKLSDVEAVAEIIEQKKEISQLKAELEKLKSSQAQQPTAREIEAFKAGHEAARNWIEPEKHIEKDLEEWLKEKEQE